MNRSIEITSATCVNSAVIASTMSTPLLLLLLLQLLSSHLATATDDNILELDPASFPLALQQFPALLVQFYAPWCPHCQELAPKYANVAKALRRSTEVKLAQLDGDRFREFVQSRRIEGFPTLVMYRNGGAIGEEYEGVHEVAPIVQWVLGRIRQRREVGLGVLELSGREFGEVVREHPFLMVQFYVPWCPFCQDLAPIYDGVAEELEKKDSEIRLAKVDASKDRPLAELYGVKRYPTMLFFRYGVPTIYDGSRDQATLIRWMEEKSLEELPVRFRSDEVPTSTITISTSRRTVPVMVNLVSMVVISAILG